MSKYTFKNISPIDFEIISRDLLQKYLDIHLESFTPGKDSGIDLRGYSNNENIIVQCKRYTSYNSLKYNLKEEYDKVKNLKFEKYIITTSVGLTPKRKNEILDIFNGLIQSPADIFGLQDLNNLLGKFPNIERKHFKLWLPNINIVEKLINNDILNRSQFEKENITKNIYRYVQNESFDEAIKILKENNFLIISGIPGIGKTTLAKILIYNYIARNYDLIVVSRDINESEKFYNPECKQVFYYDDFLGRNFLENSLSKNEDQRLIKFINKISKSSNSKLIMTTREYILNQAKIKYELLDHFNLEVSKCIIDLEKYSRMVKAKILYNHLYYSSLPEEHIENLITDKMYMEIIDHQNYNPRLIELMTDKHQFENIEPEEFSKIFIETLDNPERIWEHAFTHQISTKSRYLLYLITFTGEPIFRQDIEDIFFRYLNKTNLNIDKPIDIDYFNKALKECENSFINTFRNQNNKLLIEFQNPSIKDYIINKIKGNKVLLNNIIEHSNYINQLLGVFTLKENSTGKILLSDNLADKLEKKIINCFDDLKDSTLTRKIHWLEESPHWNYTNSSEIERLRRIANFFNLDNFESISSFIMAKIKDNKEKYVKNPNHRETLLEIIDNYSTSELDEFEPILKSILDNMENFNELELLINFINKYESIYKKYIDKNEMNFIGKLDYIIESEIDELYSEENTSRLNDVEEALVEIKDTLQVSVDEYIEEVLEIRESYHEFSENKEEDLDFLENLNDSSSDEDEIIDGIFRTLFNKKK